MLKFLFGSDKKRKRKSSSSDKTRSVKRKKNNYSSSSSSSNTTKIQKIKKSITQLQTTGHASTNPWALAAKLNANLIKKKDTRKILKGIENLKIRNSSSKSK